MITSQEIIEHLDALCRESGIKGLELIATGRHPRTPANCAFIACTGPDSLCGFQNHSDETPEKAIEKVRERIKTPAALAAEKRDAAQKLVLEAELLEREATP